MSDTYSLNQYGDMIADAARFGAYAKAIKAAVRPSDAVLEIGCGPGVFSLLGCRAGARRVYAIESADVVDVARKLAAANGLADRIEFFQGDSRRTELPERVNVIVSDIRGILPLYGQAIPSIEDARQRFLVPSGILLPQRDTLKAAVVEAKKLYSCLVAPWRKSVRDMDFSAALLLVLNEFYSSHFKSGQLLTEPQTWGTLDYARSAPRCAGAELNFRAARNATAHGLSVWFETQLFEDIGYSSGPDGASTIYGQVFLPWLEPVELVEGQEIQVELHADLVGVDYIWRWETKISGGGKGVVQHFQQSTLQGAQFSPQWLRRHATDFVPVLSEAGEAERWLLEAMDGNAPLQEIARVAAERFPKVFPRREEAFRHASKLAVKFSR